MDEGRGQCVIDGGLEVGIGEDDVRALAAELQGDLLDVFRCAAHECAPRLDPAGERDQVDQRRVGQRLSDPLALAEDQVHDPTRGTGLLEQSGQMDRRQRGQMRGLHHCSAARRECGGDLPGQLQQRVVPRPDQPAHPDGLVHDATQGRGDARLHEAPRLLVRQVGVIPEDTDHVRDIEAALAQSLAGVQGLLARELLQVPFEEIGDAIQQRRPLAGRAARPVGLVEGAARGGDRRLDLLVGRDVDLGDERAIARIDDRTARPIA
jgi:hypothetical protein